jgi:hypothetical protein
MFIKLRFFENDFVFYLCLLVFKVSLVLRFNYLYSKWFYLLYSKKRENSEWNCLIGNKFLNVNSRNKNIQIRYDIYGSKNHGPREG